MTHPEIFSRYGIAPKRSLGQNFLVDDVLLSKIAGSAGIEGKDVIEIGPGYGALTQKIVAEKPKSLVLIELDPKMVSILNDRIARGEIDASGIRDFRIVQADVLRFEPGIGDSIVVANIPYYITSPILSHFLYQVRNRPARMIIMMQREIGDRILRKRGEKSSVLSLSCELACIGIEEVAKVSAGSFIPPPKVDSIVLDFQTKNDFGNLDIQSILSLVKSGFKEKRKKLLSNLSSQAFRRERLSQIFLELGFSENVRAEELRLEDWLRLHASMAAHSEEGESGGFSRISG